MLDAATAGAVRGAFDTGVDLMGVPAVWTPVNGADSSVTVGFRTGSDEAVINAYGVGTKILTFKASSGVPAKFDTITVQSERYTVNDVNPVHLNGFLVGYKLYVKGK